MSLNRSVLLIFLLLCISFIEFANSNELKAGVENLGRNSQMAEDKNIFTNPMTGDIWKWDRENSQFEVKQPNDNYLGRFPVRGMKGGWGSAHSGFFHPRFEFSVDVVQMVFTENRNQAWVSFQGSGAGSYPVTLAYLIDISNRIVNGPGVRFFYITTGSGAEYDGEAVVKGPNVVKLEDPTDKGKTLLVDGVQYNLVDVINKMQLGLIAGFANFEHTNLRSLIRNFGITGFSDIKVRAETANNNSQTLLILTSEEPKAFKRNESLEYILKFWIRQNFTLYWASSASIEIDYKQGSLIIVIDENITSILERIYQES